MIGFVIMKSDHRKSAVREVIICAPLLSAAADHADVVGEVEDDRFVVMRLNSLLPVVGLGPIDAGARILRESS